MCARRIKQRVRLRFRVKYVAKTSEKASWGIGAAGFFSKGRNNGSGPMGKENDIARSRGSTRFQTKLAVGSSVLAVLISALLTFILYLNFRTQLRDDFRQRLRDIAAMVALDVDGDAHATLTRADQEGNPTYVRIKRVLQRNRDCITDVRFIYTWRKSPDGRIIFVVDAESDPNEMSHLGDVYDSAEPSLLAQLATLDHIAADKEFMGDKWGVWLSGYAPFYRSDGQMEGILGVDISAADVLMHEHQFLRIALAVLGAIVPLAVAMGLWFGRSLAAPIVELTLGSERIAQGDLSHRVPVKGNDETRILAQSFNKMTDTLYEAILNRDTEISIRKKVESALSVLNRDLQATVQRLSRANDELRSVAFITSHDLKTPLRGIRVLAHWIAADYADQLDEKGREYLDLLSKRATRMYDLVEAIHQYASIGYEGSSEEVDLNMLISEVVNHLAAPDNVEITIEGDLPLVTYNKDRISQVFESLLENAVRYMDKPHGRIVVRCTEEATCWQISVTDNGPGIDEKYHQKVFEICQTLSTKGQPESTGMGLSIAKKIVESYGGEIWIDSRLGQGATFFFTLPKQTAALAEQNAALLSV
jgi:signal transduction histidine kinase